MTYTLAPFCYSCGAVRGAKAVNDLEGKPCKTVESLDRCAQCLIATYCSAVCQKAHWKKHKQVCEPSPYKLDYKLLIPAMTISLDKLNPTTHYIQVFVSITPEGPALIAKKDKYALVEREIMVLSKEAPYAACVHKVSEQFPDKVIIVLTKRPEVFEAMEKMARVIPIERIKLNRDQYLTNHSDTLERIAIVVLKLIQKP